MLIVIRLVIGISIMFVIMDNDNVGSAYSNKAGDRDIHNVRNNVYSDVQRSK